jgi:hypothetical protein
MFTNNVVTRPGQVLCVESAHYVLCQEKFLFWAILFVRGFKQFVSDNQDRRLDANLNLDCNELNVQCVGASL